MMYLWLRLLILNLRLVTAILPAELIYQFPNGTFVENIAVRSNGELLVTLVSAPEIYSIQPSSANPSPKLVHRFSNFTTVTGITEVRPYVFLVAVTSISPQQATAGAGVLFELDLSHGDVPKVVEIVRLTEVGLANGLTILNQDKLLIADSVKGNVVVADLKKRTAQVAITDPLLGFSSKPTITTAVNGLRVRGNVLYFTNTDQNIFGRIEIDPRTGFATGPASKIVSALPPGTYYDDFAIGKKGNVFLASGFANVIERFNLFTKAQEIISGEFNSLEISEPTSVRFGRNGKHNTIFVTTGGGSGGTPPSRLGIVGGQVLKIKIDGGY